MAKKKFQFPVRVGVHDPSKDRVEKLDTYGRIIQHGRIGTKYVDPGEWVEVEEAEGKAIIAQFGPWIDPATRTIGSAKDPNGAVKRIV